MTVLLVVGLTIAIICWLFSRRTQNCSNCTRANVEQAFIKPYSPITYTAPQLLSEEEYILNLITGINGAGLSSVSNSLVYEGLPQCRIANGVAIVSSGSQQIALSCLEGKVHIARLGKAGEMKSGIALDQRALLQALCGLGVIMSYNDQTHYVENDDDND